MLNKKTVRDVEVSGKRVLVRCDFNVPLDKEDPSKITSDKRIVESLKTIKYLINAGARVILCSHLGKTGQNKSLAPVAKRLSEYLEKDVPLLKDIVSDSTKEFVMNMEDGDVCLLENTRMYEEEEKNDAEFSRKLASLAEIFVNDAFGSAHRAHASTEGVTHYLPSVAGFLIEKEIAALDGGINNPKRPLVAIVGGSKVSSKIAVLTNLLDKVDSLLIGGAMMFTFVKAQGGNIGKSLCEDDKIEVAKEIIKKAEEKNVKFVLPIDVVVADEMSEVSNTFVCKPNEIPDDYMGLDIGPSTEKLFENYLKEASIAVWNGPLGVYEFEKYKQGTDHILKFVVDNNIKIILGGGDIVAAASQSGYKEKVYHASTGGGATLEYLEGKKLPGLEAIK